MKKINKRLWRRIKHTKGQFVAIVGLVAIGIMVYVAMSMAIVNLESSLKLYYKDSNFSDIFAQVVKIPQNKIQNLSHSEGIDKVEGRLVQDVLMKTDDDSKVKIRLVSVPEEPQINELYYYEGGPIENLRKDALVIKQFAEGRNLKIGDEIKLNILGKEHKLKVKGIVSSPEFVYLMENEQSMMPMPDKFGIVYLSEKLAQESLAYGENFNEIVFTATKGKDLDYVKDKLENKLDRYGLKRLYTKEQQLSNSMVSEEIKGVKASAKVVPVIFLGAAAMTIAFMLSRIVKNDRTSIGVLKALGYTNYDVLIHYTAYSLIIGIVGALLGVTLGTVLSGFYSEMYRQFFKIPYLKIVIYYDYIFWGILLSGGFCVVSGILGTKSILQIAPAESMRPEAPKSAKKIYIDKIAIIWKSLSFSWKMVVRNMLRSKKRFLFIIIGIAISYSNIVFIINMMSSSFKLYEIQFGEYQQIDYTISFTKPLHERVIKQINELIETDNIEAKIEYPYELNYKWRSKVVSLIGVSKDTEFYHLVDKNNKAIKIPQDGILISEGLAKSLQIEKGDKIEIDSFLPDRKNLKVRVSGIVQQALGINAYMNIETMQKQMLDEQMITGVMIKTDEEIKEELDDVKNIMTIQSDKDYKEMFSQFLGLMITSTTISVFMAGFIGFTIIYSSTVVNINERRLELASLRIMGFSKEEIFKLMKKENRIMTILGLALGIPLGNWMSNAVTKAFSTDIYTLKVIFDWRVYVISIGLTLIFVLLAQGFAKRKVKHINFIEALKNRMT